MLPVQAAVQPRPTSVGTLVMWYDASCLDTAGPLASWKDLAGGRTASQTSSNNRPTFAPQGLAGRPAVLFDGVRSFLSMASGGLDTAGWHLFVVHRRDAGSSYQTLLQVARSDNGYEAAMVALNSDPTYGGLHVGTWGVSTSRYAKGGTVSVGTPAILYAAASATGSSPSCFSATLGGASLTLAESTQSYVSTGPQSVIGAAVSYGYRNRHFSGAISEIRAYSSLSAGSAQSVLAELRRKWGVS